MAEDDLSPLQRAVQEAIDRSGKARDHLDGQLRVSLKTKGKPLWDVLRGKSKKPEPRTLRAIEAVLELRAGTLVELVHGGVTHAEAPAQPIARIADAGETVEIIRLDLSLPMGPGATVEDYVEEQPLRFDLGYVQAFTRTPAHRLRLAHGVGDSMFPTLLNNDLVWIDSTQTTLNQADKVWAVSINGAAAIKRLRPLRGGKVLVISDNPTIDNYEVAADELRIGGRVIRFARDL